MTRFQQARRTANAVLAGLLVLFVVLIPFRHHSPVVQWILYGLEASLAAAFADWFAVTALFQRHRILGWSIPHTGIIPRKHAQIGKGLVLLMRRQLLPESRLEAAIDRISPSQVLLQYAERLGPAELARMITSWLRQAGEAESLAAALHDGLSGWLGRLRFSRRVAGFLEQRLARQEVEPGLHAVLRWIDGLLASEEGRIEIGLQLGKLKRETIEAQEGIRRWLWNLAEDWGALEEHAAANDTVKAVRRELRRATQDPGHELHQALRTWMERLAQELREESELSQSLDAWWAEVVRTLDLREMMGGLAAALRSESSVPALEPAIGEAIAASVRALSGNAQVAELIDGQARGVLKDLLPLVYQILEPFVQYVFAQRLTEADLVAFIETEVGDLLQRLRLTGTIVGGIAGLAIAWICAGSGS
jgi:uncharacterized membrane-anchored protein YjiN (DUF445 family)